MKKFRVSYQVCRYAECYTEVEATDRQHARAIANNFPQEKWNMRDEGSGWESTEEDDFLDIREIKRIL